MKFNLLIVFLFAGFKSFAQSDNVLKLKKYLADHCYEIDFSKDSSMPVFTNIMQGKKLFVFGEGGSHSLRLNEKMRTFLLQQFSTKPLKYFFLETGRSQAYNINNAILYCSDSVLGSRAGRKINIEASRKILRDKPQFAYKGIDMEWGLPLYLAVKDLCIKTGVDRLEKLPLLKLILRDTSYLHLNDDDAYDNQKKFLKYYKKWKKQFYADSILYKSCFGDHYETFKYFFSNPQTKPPYGNRNPGMAKNLLMELDNDVAKNDTSSVYLLDVGMAHSMPNAKASVVSIVSKSNPLNNKVVVMNVYCLNCHIEEEKLSNWVLDKLMQRDIINCFISAAKTNLTLFDLSKLPAEFDYIKAYGDLLFFAKNQN